MSLIQDHFETLWERWVDTKLHALAHHYEDTIGCQIGLVHQGNMCSTDLSDLIGDYIETRVASHVDDDIAKAYADGTGLYSRLDHDILALAIKSHISMHAVETGESIEAAIMVGDYEEMDETVDDSELPDDTLTPLPTTGRQLLVMHMIERDSVGRFSIRGRVCPYVYVNDVEGTEGDETGQGVELTLDPDDVVEDEWFNEDTLPTGTLTAFVEGMKLAQVES